MGRFQLLNLGVLRYALELRFWVVIAIIVSLTLTITLKVKANIYRSDGVTLMGGVTLMI